MCVIERLQALTYTRGCCSSDPRVVASIAVARETTDRVGA